LTKDDDPESGGKSEARTGPIIDIAMKKAIMAKPQNAAAATKPIHPEVESGNAKSPLVAQSANNRTPATAAM
jgi:hypothetical protein